MNWTLKYRPKQIKALNLEVIRKQLLQFMHDGYIPTTLLFAGPKGTGKTSSSRLVAAVLNEPKNEQLVDQVYFQHKNATKSLVEPDLKLKMINNILTGQSYIVNEIDAASHRGIDHIRELKERVFLPPVEGKMSVFILDEVHMLTTPAFNALLKILEEPPDHAIFILATTEPEKIPATVISRCQVLRFRQAQDEEIIDVLSRIAKKEKLETTKPALSLIAHLAEGSFRDAIKYLELATIDHQLKIDQIEKLVGKSMEAEAKHFLELILRKNQLDLTAFFQNLRNQNANEKVFLTAFVHLLYQQLLLNIQSSSKKTLINKTVALYLLNHFNSFALLNQVMPFLGIELKALEIIEKSQKKGPRSKQSTILSKKKPQTTDIPVITAQTNKTDLIQKKPLKTEKIVLGDGNELIKQWDKFLKLVEARNSTIAALLRSANPAQGDKGQLILYVYYRFHQEQLSNPKIVHLIQEVLSHLSLGFIQFKFVLKAAKPKVNSLSDQPIDLAHQALGQKSVQLAQVAAKALM